MLDTVCVSSSKVLPSKRFEVVLRDDCVESQVVAVEEVLEIVEVLVTLLQRLNRFVLGLLLFAWQLDVVLSCKLEGKGWRKAALQMKVVLAFGQLGQKVVN